MLVGSTEKEYISSYVQKGFSSKDAKPQTLNNDYILTREIVYGVLACSKLEIKDDKIYFNLPTKNGGQFSIDLNNKEIKTSQIYTFAEAKSKQILNMFAEAYNSSAKFGTSVNFKTSELEKVDFLPEEKIISKVDSFVRNMPQNDKEEYIEIVTDNFDSIVNELAKRGQDWQTIKNAVADYWNDNDSTIRKTVYGAQSKNSSVEEEGLQLGE